MSINLPIEIKMVSTNDVHPDPGNPRLHSDDQVDSIIVSIQEFGWTNPLLVDSKMNVVAGHGRLLAAQKMGLDKIPVIDIGHLSKAQLRAYLIADNKIAIDAGWDLPALASELDDLDKLGFPTEIIGFSAEAFNVMMENLPKAEDVSAPAPGSFVERNAILEYTVIFDDTDQQRQWFAFVRHLKASYPDADTFGARLEKFIIEGGYATQL